MLTVDVIAATADCSVTRTDAASVVEMSSGNAPDNTAAEIPTAASRRTTRRRFLDFRCTMKILSIDSYDPIPGSACTTLGT